MRRITFGLALVAAVALAGGGCPMDALTNDSPSVSLSVDQTEIAEDGEVAIVTASLDAATHQPVVVTLAYSGTAESGKDYTRSSMTITIPAFKTTGTVTLTGLTDTTADGDRPIIIDIAAVTGGTEDGDQQVTVTVLDKSTDQPATVYLTLLDTTGANQLVTEGNFLEPADGQAATSANEVKVYAQLSGAAHDDVTVDLAFAGTAVLDEDYTVSGTLSNSGSQIIIPAGMPTGSITVQAKSNPGYDNGKTIIITIASVTGAAEDKTDGKSQQVTLTKDDAEPDPTMTLALTGSPIVTDNVQAATITATLSKPILVPASVKFTLGGTAKYPDDFSRSSLVLEVPAGEITGQIRVIAKSHDLYQGDKTIVLTPGTPANATLVSSAALTVNITDSHPTPTLTLEPKVFSLNEDGGIATLTATQSVVSGVDTTVNLAFNGTALKDTDYTASDTKIVIPAGQTTGALTLTGKSDTTYEPSEQIIVSITSATNAAASGVQEVIGVINDKDAPPTVTLALSGSPIAESGGRAIVTATLSNTSSQVVTVKLAFAGAAAKDTDYTASDVEIKIPIGRITGAITLAGINDGVDEGDETIIVSIDTVTNGTENGVQQVTATISDILPTVTLALSGSPIAENGGVATVTATLSRTVVDTVTIQFGFAGSAVRTTDYTASNTSIVVPAGQTTGTLTITAIDDEIYEASDSVVLTAQEFQNAAGTGANQFTVAITDSTPAKNLAAGEAFLAQNATAPGVIVTGSGLQYKVLVAGSGATPTAADTVIVKYRGTLIDGTEFDSSNGDTVTFGVTQVIDGWVEALQLMPVGSKWMLYVPSDLAYGDRQASALITPNSTLIFEVELVGIQGG